MPDDVVDFQLQEHSRCIQDLYDKYEGIATVIAILPEKLEQQTGILREMKDSLVQLPVHQAQLAVLAEVVSDYKELKKDYIPVKEKVTRMDAEWSLVKWIIPIGITILNIAIAVLFKFL